MAYSLLSSDALMSEKHLVTLNGKEIAAICSPQVSHLLQGSSLKPADARQTRQHKSEVTALQIAKISCG